MPSTTSTAITTDESGEGDAVLVLHGGGGPVTVQGLAAALATRHHVITPTHPGWNGTDRLPGVLTITDLAGRYLDLLEQRDLSDVTVVGSSVGGWIAAEMALQDASREGRVARLVLIDAAGIEVPNEPVTPFFGLTPRQIAEHSFDDPDTFFRDPATFTPEQRAVQQANLATMAALTNGGEMTDPGLAGRLGALAVPTLVVWGASDGFFTPAYGQAYADAVPGARFVLVEHAGHLPQLERPEDTLAAITAFLDSE